MRSRLICLQKDFPFLFYKPCKKTDLSNAKINKIEPPIKEVNPSIQIIFAIFMN